MIFVGTAGWSIPAAARPRFPDQGSHLERYARVLGCVEVNSSFYRPHVLAVYARWARCTPPGFRFSVKVPRAITHEQRLRRARAALEQFLGEVAGLGPKQGPLLVQLPPSLEFDARVARTFFQLLRDRHAGAIVCEPRHATWFEPAAERLLVGFQVGRVAADPGCVPAAQRAGGWMGPGDRALTPVVYYRLHGSPRMYWSRYSIEQIRTWADELRALPSGVDAWCVFDNTAAGAAIENALELHSLSA